MAPQDNSLEDQQHNSLEVQQHNRLEKRQHNRLEDRQHNRLEDRQYNSLEDRHQNSLEVQQHNSLEDQQHNSLDDQQRNSLDDRQQNSVDVLQHNSLEVQQHNRLDVQQHNSLEVQQHNRLDVQHNSLEDQQHNSLEDRQQNSLDVLQHNSLDVQQHNRLEDQQHNSLEDRHQNRLDVQQHNRLEVQQHNRLDVQQYNNHEVQQQRTIEVHLYADRASMVIGEHRVEVVVVEYTPNDLADHVDTLNMTHQNIDRAYVVDDTNHWALYQSSDISLQEWIDNQNSLLYTRPLHSGIQMVKPEVISIIKDLLNALAYLHNERRYTRRLGIDNVYMRAGIARLRGIGSVLEKDKNKWQENENLDYRRLRRLIKAMFGDEDIPAGMGNFIAALQHKKMSEGRHKLLRLHSALMNHTEFLSAIKMIKENFNYLSDKDKSTWQDSLSCMKKIHKDWNTEATKGILDITYSYRTTKYGNDAKELLRFMRNVATHLIENLHNERRHNPEDVSVELLRAFPTFLGELQCELHKKSPTILELLLVDAFPQLRPTPES